MVDLPDDGWPRISTCLEGIERDVETESRIDDHKSCGGALSGVGGRELSIAVERERVAVQHGLDLAETRLMAFPTLIISHRDHHVRRPSPSSQTA